MRSASDEILNFIKVLANYPNQVQVTKIEGNPVIIEIKVAKDDFANIKSKEHAIMTICISTAGLKKGQCLLKIIEGE